MQASAGGANDGKAPYDEEPSYVAEHAAAALPPRAYFSAVPNHHLTASIVGHAIEQTSMIN